MCMWLFLFSQEPTKCNLVHSSVKKIRISRLTIILSVGAIVFHADKRTYNMTKIIVVFYNSFKMCFKLDSSASQHLPVTF
jgi:hypothetical protein